MSFGLHKAGQGYWVRVLAASMGGIIVLAACAWAWNELERASVLIPKPTAVLNLSPPVAGSLAPGTQIGLLGEPSSTTGEPQSIGTATVKSDEYEPSGRHRVEVEKIQMTGRHDVSQIKAIAAAPGGPPVSGKLLGGPQQVDLFDPLYIRGAGVAILLVLGAGLTWWLVGVRPRSVEFLIATDGEMKKVNWSTRKDVLASTWVVILWSVLLATGLFVADYVFAVVFKLIGVLQA